MKKFIIVALALMVVATPARAQQAPQTIQQPAQDTVRRGVTPGGAFLRSLILPGWGQYSVGAKKRAGIFFAFQTASYFMLVKTLNKLGDAQDIESERVDLVSDSLRARMAQDTAFNRQLSDEFVFRQHVDSAATVVEIRKLVDSRKEQRQDWIAYTLFTTLASGVDAYVAAHLADFPGAITTRPTPDGRAQLKITVPFQRRP